MYNILKSYDNNGVNMSLYDSAECLKCVSCGSHNVSMLINKLVYTASNKYLAYRCNDCSIVMRGSKSGEVSDKLVRVV